MCAQSEPLDLYGDIVGHALEVSPALARVAIRTGFDFTAWKSAHLPDKTRPLWAQLNAKTFFSHLTQGLDHPDNAVATSIFLPTEIFQALKVLPLCAEAVAGTCAGAHAEQAFLKNVEGHGIPETYCSYHRVLMGLATSGTLVAPRMLAASSVACDANNLTFKTLAHVWDVPNFYVDVPYEVSKEAVLYVAEQLREMAKTAEDVYGRALDNDELKACVSRSIESLELMERALGQRRGKDVANDLMGELMTSVNMHLALGTRDTQALLEQLLRDLCAQKPSQKPGIIWVHSSPFFLTPLTQMLEKHQVRVITSDMSYTQIGLPKWFGPSQPFEAMAERLVYNSYNGSARRRTERIRELVRATGAAGAVVFSHWGCKHTAGASELIRQGIEDMGCPTLILDGDGADRSNNMSGQMNTRLEAFLELVARGEVDNGRH